MGEGLDDAFGGVESVAGSASGADDGDGVAVLGEKLAPDVEDDG